jgi:hypothetical protein
VEAMKNLDRLEGERTGIGVDEPFDKGGKVRFVMNTLAVRNPHD